MIDIGILESQRLEMQHILDGKKTQEERNKLGQFATPTKLATDILSYAKSLMTETHTLRFLDPAFGTGSFFSALLKAFPLSNIKATGYEIDPVYCHNAAELWRDTNLKLHFADFTSALPPIAQSEKATLLICNPPYVRHHHLTKVEKQRLVNLGHQTTGIRLSEQAGLYGHFLFLSHNWLAEDGLACWLIPGEFMDVNYGQKMKEYLLRNVTLLHVHCFDPEDRQFQDALVSSSVVWFKKSLPPDNHHVTFTKGGTLAAPQIHKSMSRKELFDIAKWTRIFQMVQPQEVVDSEAPQSLLKPSSKKVVAPLKRPLLSDFFHIKRGLATGANNFFILSQKDVSEYQLPEEFLTPVLPSPRSLPTNEIFSAHNGYPLLKQLLFLLTCDLPESEVQINYPSLWKYLQIGRNKGIDKGYLCSSRKLWYAQEKRPPGKFLCAYMGRQKTDEDRPFRFLINHSQATATNAYHILYPNVFLQRIFDTSPEMVTVVGQALQTISSEVLINEGRVYGGGLHKMEPRELANVPADAIFSQLAHYSISLPTLETTFPARHVVNQSLWASY